MKKIVVKLLPFAGILLALLVDELVPDSSLQPAADKPYYFYFLWIMAAVYGILFILTFLVKKVDEKIIYSAPFYAGAAVLVTGINLVSTLELKRKLADLGFKVNGSDADVNFVAYSMPDLPAALENGAVDAIGVHEPMGTKVEANYKVVKLLDTGEDEKFKDEYCCMALTTRDLIKNNPEGAAAFARAVQKGAAYAQANPEEAAKIQIEKKYVSGNPKTNAEIIKGLDFNPGVKAARETFSNAFSDLQATGDLDSKLDEKEFTKKAFPELKNVPETTTYDAKTKKFTTSDK